MGFSSLYRRAFSPPRAGGHATGFIPPTHHDPPNGEEAAHICTHSTADTTKESGERSNDNHASDSLAQASREAVYRPRDQAGWLYALLHRNGVSAKNGNNRDKREIPRTVVFSGDDG